MKEVWQKRAAVNIIDGHKDYLQDLARIASPTFRPTTQDILLARVKTTQVVMERYRIDGIDFEMYDVGGQRSERRKWIDCFDNVDAERTEWSKRSNYSGPSATIELLQIPPSCSF